MLMLCLCALAGAYTLQLCSHLPDKFLLIVLVPVSLAAFFAPGIRFAGAYLLGLLLLAFAAHGVIDATLSPAFAGKTSRIDAAGR